MEGSTTIRIEVVTSWDTDEIISLYRAGGWWKPGYDPVELPALIRSSFAFTVAVDEKTGTAIGMGRAISDGVSDAYIQDLVVMHEFRGQGIGKKILTCLIEYCLSKRIYWIGLIAEPGTAEFYLPAGFSRMEGYIPMLYDGDRRQ
jgi:GNAT superfamily N-acetyltransferase